MTIIYNGQRYDVPDDFLAHRELNLLVALATPDAPDQWTQLITADIDTGSQFHLVISKNVIEKFCLHVTPEETVSIALVDGHPRDAVVVRTNLRVKGIHAADTTLLNVRTLVVDLPNEVTVGMPLVSLFNLISKQGRTIFWGFEEAVVK